MKKPHEQEWTVSQKSPTVAPAVVSGPEDEVCIIRVPYKADGKWNVPQMDETKRITALISAAPDMARALLKVLDEHAAYMPHTATEIEATLKKAGVL